MTVTRVAERKITPAQHLCHLQSSALRPHLTSYSPLLPSPTSHKTSVLQLLLEFHSFNTSNNLRDMNPVGVRT